MFKELQKEQQGNNFELAEAREEGGGGGYDQLVVHFDPNRIILVKQFRLKAPPVRKRDGSFSNFQEQTQPLFSL